MALASGHTKTITNPPFQDSKLFFKMKCLVGYLTRNDYKKLVEVEERLFSYGTLVILKEVEEIILQVIRKIISSHASFFSLDDGK